MLLFLKIPGQNQEILATVSLELTLTFPDLEATKTASDDLHKILHRSMYNRRILQHNVVAQLHGSAFQNLGPKRSDD